MSAAGTDARASAPPIAIGDTSAATNATSFTLAAGENVSSGYAGLLYRSAWWYIEPTADGWIKVDTQLSPAGTDTFVTAWADVGSGVLVEIAYDDDSGGGLYSLLDFYGYAAFRYYLQVTSYDATGALSYVVRVGVGTATGPIPPPPEPPSPPPDNDNFADAAVIAYGGTSDSVPSNAATQEAGEPNVSVNSRTVWWKFTAPATETVGIDTLQSVFTGDSYNADTYINVYTGSSLGALVEVASGSDNQRPGTTYGYLTEMDFDAVAGTTYSVQVGSTEGAVDMDYVLRLGRRIGEWSDWSECDDYVVTYEPDFGQSASHHRETRSLTGIPAAAHEATLVTNLNDMLADTIDYPVDTFGTESEFHVSTAAVGTIRSATIRVGFHAIAYFPNYGDPFDPVMNGCPAPGTPPSGAWIEWENARTLSSVVAAQITRLMGLVESHSETFAGDLPIEGAFPFSVLPGSVWDDFGGAPEFWPLDEGRLLLNIPFHVYNDGTWHGIGNFYIDGSFDVTSEVNENGNFLFINARPAVITSHYTYSTAGNSIVKYSAWPLEMRYTFRPPRWRFVYSLDVDSGVTLGVLKVKVDTAGATEIDRWQSWGFPNETAGAGRVLASDGWHVADDDAATVSGLLKIKVDETTWADVSWMTPE